jgi:endonuclease/exonuclease/phosphatase family metal-dependent hydrolase
VRVVSWNVRSLRDDVPGGGVAAALQALDPDIALVQEAPRLWRSGAACRRLARGSGLSVVTGGRAAAGNLLLVGSRVGVRSSYDVVLPRRPGLHRRAAVMAVLDVEGRALAVLGTHLDLDPDARLDSAQRVRAAAPADLPLVVGADVNDDPGSPAWGALGNGLVDAGEGLGPTFSVRSPRRRIDAVFVDDALTVRACRVEDTGAVSDHFAVVADLAWR